MPLTPLEPAEDEFVYRQAADHLERWIRAELRPGAKLPPERELAADLGVAYNTVRLAMGVLRERGVIRTLHGRGTFVKSSADDD